jgi:pimeloyl-ACP methyl ester carboxylesterase
MRYFSGFCLQNEFELFKRFVTPNDFCVVGFSYGAINALRYVLSANERIDTLILLSPAYFVPTDEKFKKMQLLFYKKDTQNYLQNFAQNVCYPSSTKIEKYIKPSPENDLKDLLYYDWKEIEKLPKDIRVEIHIGAKDKIINPLAAKDFFMQRGECYVYKNYGHLLQE